MTSLVGVNYWRLPVEMQQRAQWCLAGPDKAPYLAGSNGLYRASPIEGPWLDFHSAINLSQKYNCGIGYIITEGDPFTCIDMDVKDAASREKNGDPVKPEKWTSKLELDFYLGIMQFAQSYTELSAGGCGLHTWVYGDIGAGRRGKGMEVYSKERFIVCTGRPVTELEYRRMNNIIIAVVRQSLALPIVDGSLLIQNLAQELGAAGTKIELTEVEQELTDEQIWSRAATAGNSEKFIELCKGNWTQYNFPSQSEADLALLSMFTFYSKSNEQCRRMFRQTHLGFREKAVKDNVYLDRTLRMIRARQERDTQAQSHGEAIALSLLANKRATEEPVDSASLVPKNPNDVNPNVLEYVRHIDQTRFTEGTQNVIDYVPPEVEGLAWPPGLVGAIAGFIYQNAPRPVKEVAIVAALGLMAGITGKAYNVGQTGLNLYIILIARSAIGKEAMLSGIGHIMRSQCGQVISPFVDFTDYVSGPALTKAMERSTSFVNISGEWGRKLQRMAEDRRDGPMQQVRTVMTNLYQKSGAASVMGGLGYSNSDQNIASVNSVAYSMIGETTPGTFYDSLTPTMMEDGFLSRFNIVEYHGDRPTENKSQLMQVPKQISDTLASIASHCVGIINRPNGAVIQVSMDDEAEMMLEDFNLECDKQIHNAGPDESIRQIWNRAHLKAVRVSGVLAASDNHIKPVINCRHAGWAIELIKTDARSMLAKVRGGDIGADDHSRERKLQRILNDYLLGRVPKSYKIDPKMLENGIVPKKFLQKRTCQIRCFMGHRMGSAMGLDQAIKGAIENGYLMEVSRDKMVETHNFHGKCYRILDIDDE